MLSFHALKGLDHLTASTPSPPTVTAAGLGSQVVFEFEGAFEGFYPRKWVAVAFHNPGFLEQNLYPAKKESLGFQIAVALAFQRRCYVIEAFRINY
jgi:hypothetical protein